MEPETWEQRIEKAKKAVQEAKEQGYNLITEDLMNFDLYEKWVAPAVKIVQLDPDTDGKDVYEQNKRIAIHSEGLFKLAAAAGLEWNSKLTERLDDRKNRDIVAFQAAGRILTRNGHWLELKDEKELDMICIAEDVRDAQEALGQKYNKPKAAVEKAIRKEVNKKYKDRAQLALTGVQCRIMRKLLGIQGTYSAEKIKKPFCVVQASPFVDLTNPAIKEAVERRMVKEISNVFGGNAPVQDSVPARIAYDEQPAIDVLPVDSEEIDQFPESEPPVPGPEQKNCPAPEAPAASPSRSNVDDQFPEDSADPKTDFRNSSPEEQIAILRSLMKSKGLLEANLKAPLDQFSKAERLGTFNYLMAQPDKKAA